MSEENSPVSREEYSALMEKLKGIERRFEKVADEQTAAEDDDYGTYCVTFNIFGVDEVRRRRKVKAQTGIAQTGIETEHSRKPLPFGGE